MSIAEVVELRERIAELEEKVRALQLRLNAVEAAQPKAPEAKRR